MSRVSLLGGFAVAALAALALSAALATLIGAITAGNDAPIRESCVRQCRVGEHFTCKFDLLVHTYQTYSWNCKTCSNLSCTDHPGCIQADGITRLITVVNEQLPGPMIQVCEGDNVRVTVKNLLVSSGVSIHWHGLSMRGKTGGQGFPHMDGEPWVTQCPVTPHTSFTYSFIADPPGTHFWHAQTGFQRADGVFGALIVKGTNDPNNYLYDEDLSDHVIIINDWAHILGEEKFFLHLLGGFTDYPKSILVNGLGPHEGNSIVSVPHPVKQQRFQVVKGTKYRFRLISGAFLNCPVVLSIDKHLLMVIATDGNPVTPYNASSILIHPGERWDFVLHANQYPQPYWMSFMGQNDCVHDSVFQTAVLDYVASSRHRHRLEKENGQNILPLQPKPRFSLHNPPKKNIKGQGGPCNSVNICFRDLHSVESLPPVLAKERPDVALYFGFTKTNRNRTTVRGYFPDVLSELRMPPGVEFPVPLINGLGFIPPPVPVIFQPTTPKRCRLNVGSARSRQGTDDDCLHIVKIPLGSVTDLVLVDEGINEQGGVVHLHGYRFYILSEVWGPLEESSDEEYIKVEQIKEMDSSAKIKRNLIDPVQKDTLAIPNKGYVILRFRADNPGFWTLESQLLFDSQLGMKLVLQVGEPYEIPSPPPNFPRCGGFH